LRDFEGRAEIDCFSAGFGVWQENRAALEIDVIPFAMEDFPQAGAGECEEANCGDREWPESWLGFGEGVAEACELVSGEKAFAALQFYGNSKHCRKAMGNVNHCLSLWKGTIRKA
jgi:hypothetical protein